MPRCPSSAPSPSQRPMCPASGVDVCAARMPAIAATRSAGRAPSRGASYQRPSGPATCCHPPGSEDAATSRFHWAPAWKVVPNAAAVSAQVTSRWTMRRMSGSCSAHASSRHCSNVGIRSPGSSCTAAGWKIRMYAANPRGTTSCSVPRHGWSMRSRSQSPAETSAVHSIRPRYRAALPRAWPDGAAFRRESPPESTGGAGRTSAPCRWRCAAARSRIGTRPAP